MLMEMSSKNLENAEKSKDESFRKLELALSIIELLSQLSFMLHIRYITVLSTMCIFSFIVRKKDIIKNVLSQ